MSQASHPVFLSLAPSHSQRCYELVSVRMRGASSLQVSLYYLFFPHSFRLHLLRRFLPRLLRSLLFRLLRRFILRIRSLFHDEHLSRKVGLIEGSPNSWSLEPNRIKEQYSEWARLERINHQSAHPEYKFSPRKLGGSKASKVKVSKEVTTEESKLGDFESQNSSKRGSKKHRPLHIMIQQPVPCPTTESAYQYTYPAAGYRIDLSQGERSLDRSNTHDPGLPSTYYDESHNGEHY
ncbi:hypothetical protein IFR05_014924 [Cadophora sp. M221]|nr:hypothetical protein IFR05_014924 [Cadophora sp. M221]